MLTRISLLLLSIIQFSVTYPDSQCFAATHLVAQYNDTTIQEAIDAAEEGDTVLVDPGTYTGEGNRDLNFRGKNIVLISDCGPENTVIDCEELGRGFYLYSGESETAVIAGFTVKNGYSDNRGASIYISNSTPLITSCFIFFGFSPNGGAGICLESSSSIIEGCSISNCYRRAIYSEYSNSIVKNCLIQDNRSMNKGAGFYLYHTNAFISDCTITGNTIDCDGDAQGGGIYSYKSDIIVERSEISNNTCEGGWIAWVEGGGIYCYAGSAIISDCLISGNSADAAGGIFLSSTAYAYIGDSHILANTAYRYSGGGLYSGYNQQVDMSRCSVMFNESVESGGGIRINPYDNSEYENLIVRSNIPDQTYGWPEINWSNIEGFYPGEGNIDEDPLFVAPEYGDFRLLWGSPCIDSGNPDSLDMDGTRSDMGAHSFDQSKELIVYLSPETREIAPGDSARVKYTICNAHPNEKNFGTAAGVRLPDGAPWPGNPLEDPFYTSIAPSSNLTREFEYRVPLAWPEGTSSLAAGVGFAGRIYDLDHFEFTVW